MGFPGGSDGKASACNAGDLGLISVSGRSPEEGNGNPLQSMEPLRVGHDWATSLSFFTLMQWRRKWQHTPVFLPGESQGQRSLLGCRLWGRTESDMTDAAASTITWKIPWTEEPGRLQSMGSQKAGQDWATSLLFKDQRQMVHNAFLVKKKKKVFQYKLNKD